MAAKPVVVAKTPAPATRCLPEEADARLIARERAISRGMDWMERFLGKGDNGRVLAADSVSIFTDLAAPVRPGALRERALALARKYARVAHAELFGSGPEGLDDVSDFHEGLWLLAEADLLALPKASMLAALRARFARFRGADDAYDVAVSRLRTLGEEPLYQSLLAAFTFERVRALYPNDFRVSFGLADLMPYLWTRKYITRAEDDEDGHLYNDHLMLATHIGYVLSEYTRVTLPKHWLGPLYDYLRREYPNAVALGDPEYVSEIVDVLRATGLREEDDPIVCDGTLWMLARQRPDGSWVGAEEPQDAYDSIHPTWTVVHALRGLVPDDTRPYAKHIRAVVAAARRKMAAAPK